MVGRYEVEGKLGAGGMGTVYLGRSPGGRPAAVKLISANYQAQPQALERFRREVEILRTVRSAYSAALIDFEVMTPPYWLATEYIPGPTLAATVGAEGPLPTEECLRLMAALAEGLGDIHAHGVCHRDLKPQNIIVSVTGPRLIDFGIAREAGQAGLTQTGMTIGSPGFTAPELLIDNQVTPAADVFALGATVAYAATGRRPYGNGAFATVCLRLMQEDIDVEGAEPSLAAIIRSCVASSSRRRPSPDQIIQECRNLLLDRANAGTVVLSRGSRESVAAAAPPAGSAASSAAVPAQRLSPSEPTTVVNSLFPLVPPRPSGPPSPPGADAPVFNPSGHQPPPGGPVRRRSRLPLALGAALVALLVIGGGVFVALRSSRSGDDGPPTAARATASPAVASASASVSPSPSAVLSATAPPSAAAPVPVPSAEPATTGPSVTTLTAADGRCVQAPKVGSNGARAEAATCDGSASQRWRFTAQGAFMLASSVAANSTSAPSTRCLDVGANAGADIGYRVQVWDCNGGAAQIWTLRSDGALYLARAGRCLSILPSSQGGPALAISACTGKADQRWAVPGV